MVRYIKCPRCELNYIDPEKQEYCDVCLKEMKGLATSDDIDETEDDDAATELCPVCGENMMRPGEKMCEECRKKAEYEEEEPDPDEDDEWREYLDDDTDADLDQEMGELDEALAEELEKEVEEEEPEEEDDDYQESSDDDEDLDYVTGDEIYSLGDDDDDDDDEKEDKEDDDF